MPYTSYIFEELSVTKAVEFKNALIGTKFYYRNTLYEIIGLENCLYSLHGTEPWSIKVKAIAKVDGISLTKEFRFDISEHLINNELDYKSMQFAIVNGEIVQTDVGQEVLNNI